MKKLIIAALLLTASSVTLAGPKCTDGENANWIPEDTMKQQIEEQGYSIKKFKKTSGGCYEIYGYDNKNNKVEIYFHPETGDIVKKKMD
ncbi:PepSY domain-containing protein [Neptunomonas phycophila]